MSRQKPRRGGAIKGLAAVLVLLIAILVYMAWQDAVNPWDLPGLLLSIPIWFYIALLSISAVFTAAFAREARIASRAANSSPANREELGWAARAYPETPDPITGPSRQKPHRMVIDFVPVAKAPSREVTSLAQATPEEGPLVSASSENAYATNAWPTEHVPLGKPPGERAQKSRPTLEAPPIAVTPAIPEPYLGSDLESARDPTGGAAVEAAPVNSPPETLLGRLMNWLDETSPEAVTKRRRRLKKSGR